MEGFVYKWVNNLNKMWYSGSHKGTIDDGYISSSREFNKVVKEIGIKNFTRYVLYEGLDFREVEGLHLKSHDAKNDPTCYNDKNSAIGGNGGGWNHTPEAKLKISKAQLGRISWPEGREFSDEHRENMSKARLGKEPWNKNKEQGGLIIKVEGIEFNSRLSAMKHFNRSNNWVKAREKRIKNART